MALDDGAYDTGFALGGRQHIDFGSAESASSVHVLADLGVLLVGSCGVRLAGPTLDASACAIRLSEDGSPAPWGNLGNGRSLLGDVLGQAEGRNLFLGKSLIDDTGRLLLTLRVIGTPFDEAGLVRLDANGTRVEARVGLPPAPGASGLQGARSVAVAPAGAALMLSHFALPDGRLGIRVHRVRADFTLDPDFGDGGSWQGLQSGFALHALDIALDSQGRILVLVERREDASGIRQAGVFRLSADGNLDLGWGVDGLVVLPFATSVVSGGAVAVDAMDRVLTGGAFADPMEPDTDIYVARWTADGVLDGDFAGGSGLLVLQMEDLVGFGGNESLRAIAVMPDASIVATGSITDRLGGDFFLALHLDPGGNLVPGFGPGRIQLRDLRGGTGTGPDRHRQQPGRRPIRQTRSGRLRRGRRQHGVRHGCGAPGPAGSARRLIVGRRLRIARVSVPGSPPGRASYRATTKAVQAPFSPV
jgi:uncharacterized delta-60 repeat protein